jgi:hypothetical protein
MIGFLRRFCLGGKGRSLPIMRLAPAKNVRYSVFMVVALRVSKCTADAGRHHVINERMLLLVFEFNNRQEDKRRGRPHFRLNLDMLSMRHVNLKAVIFQMLFRASLFVIVESEACSHVPRATQHFSQTNRCTLPARLVSLRDQQCRPIMALVYLPKH